MSRILPIVIVALLAGTAGAAPKLVGYVGVHPLPSDVFCEIEGPHLHVGIPEHATTLYRVHEGRYHFIGDPTSFGYDGDTFAYHGHHPIVLVGHVHETFCALDGPHHHLYKPPASAKFVLRGDVYVFIGVKPARRPHHPVAVVDVHVPTVVVDVHYDVHHHKRHKKHKHKHHRHHHHHH
jgi:hypothetical protein